MWIEMSDLEERLEMVRAEGAARETDLLRASSLALEALRGIVAWSETVTTSHEVDALIAAARAAILALEGTSAKQKP